PGEDAGVQGPVPRAPRRALAAGRHRPRPAADPGAPRPPRGREGGRGDRRDEPRRRGRGDGALLDEAPEAHGPARHPPRAGPAHGRRSGVRGPGDAGPRAVRPPGALSSLTAAASPPPPAP